MKHGARVGVVLGGLATILTLLVGVAAANPETFQAQRSGFTLGVSGPVDLRDVNYGTGVTECPQAGRSVELPAPLDRRRKDAVEELSGQGDDRRANQDYSCFPHDEMSISANPQDGRNLVGGANDYRLGWGTSGFYASTDGGRNWYDGIIPFPSLPGGDNLDGGGDPAIVHDRAGLVYYADINFNRTDDTNGVWVSRSTNGGFTWSRPCVALAGAAPSDDVATCGGIGDPRLPGDGTIAYLPDGDALANSSIAFNDKEYIAAGPRPAGVSPTCFRPETKTAFACPPEITGVDRIYVTWTLFSQRGDPSPGSRIYVSYSDDQARSWSPPRAISGSAPFCVGSAASECAFNQGSVPTVHPTTGALYVSFLNGNTPDEDQYLVVRSLDGGQSFTGPRFVTPIFDVNYPRAVNGRRDCVTRGQGSTRAVLTNTCFRVNSYGNITVDKRGGAFADDLYVVIDDNRNGTIKSSDVDVFLFKSTNGGDTWIGPTRVNDDPTLEPSGSKAPGTSWANTPPGFDRDCGRDPENITGDASKCTVDPVGNDQFFPWVDISVAGDVNVVFQDRRLDTGSIASEWPTSRTRSGNYLSWFWGAQCRVTTADSRDCVADEALEYSGSPTGPVDPGADPVPGQSQAEFPFRGFTISDTPSNLDYAFRAGIFAGDYENVDVNGTQAHAMWTDARNGRSSRAQSGRNPACEQSDAFVDSFSASDGGTKSTARESDALFLVTPCPADAADPGNAGTTVPQPAPPGTPVALPTPPSGTEVAATPQPVANATKTAPLVGGQSVVKQARLALARVRVLRVRSVGRVVLVRVNGTVSTARVRVVLRAKSGRLLRVATRSVPTNRLTRVPNLRLDRNVAKVKVTLAR